MSTKQIVMATNNAGKIKEIQHILAHADFELLPQSNFNIADADETGLSFVENAIIKARHAAAIAKLPCIADDSGLAVDALNGAPGIYSARYAGTDAMDTENVNKLLHEMRNIDAQHRGAQFHCVIVYVKHAKDPTPLIYHGSWHGNITTSAQGQNGFGYDPIFHVAEHNCSAAQLGAAQKNLISHRAKALALLRSDWNI